MKSPDYLRGMQQVENIVIPESKISMYYDPATLFMLYYFIKGWEGNDVSAAITTTSKFRDNNPLTHTFLGFAQNAGFDNVAQLRTQFTRQADKKGYLPLYIQGENPFGRMIITLVEKLTPLEVYYVSSYSEALQHAGKLPNENNEEQS